VRTAWRWLGSLVVLAVVWWYVDWPRLLAHVKEARPGWLAASVLLCAAVILLMAARWRAALAACGIAVDGGQTRAVTFIAQFLNTFLPGATGGDLAKGWYAIEWSPARKHAALMSLVYDRLIGVLALLAVTLIAVTIQIVDHPRLLEVLRRLAWLGILVVFVFAGIYYFSDRLWRLVGRRWAPGGALVPGASRWLARAVALSAAATLVNVVSAYLVAHAVAFPATLLQCAVALAIVHFSSAMPISVGGHGLREAGFLFAFGLYAAGAAALDVDRVVAFSLLFYLRGVLASLPGGVLLALRRRRSGARPPLGAPAPVSAAERYAVPNGPAHGRS
jgi:uncharacterized membrane protein YbhN (UPF0104 family)